MDEFVEQILDEESEACSHPYRIGHCCMCDCEILSCDDHYEVETDLICGDCISDYADEYLKVWGEEY